MTGRVPSTRRRGAVGDWLFGLCVLVSLSGLAVAAAGQWRQGCGLSGVGLFVAAGIRMVLPDGMAGMLRVRRKAVDVVTFTVLGTSLLLLTIVVPELRR